jgi:hypothetical protein
MPDPEQPLDTALRAANLALSNRRRHEARRFASVELRLDDPQVGPWEVAAMASIALASALVVVGFWFW